MEGKVPAAFTLFMILPLGQYAVLIGARVMLGFACISVVILYSLFMDDYV